MRKKLFELKFKLLPNIGQYDRFVDGYAGKPLLYTSLNIN